MSVAFDLTDELGWDFSLVLDTADIMGGKNYEILK
jgi:hypothetical protein